MEENYGDFINLIQTPLSAPGCVFDNKRYIIKKSIIDTLVIGLAYSLESGNTSLYCDIMSLKK